MNPTLETLALAFAAMRQTAADACAASPALGIALAARIQRARHECKAGRTGLAYAILIGDAP